MSEVEDIAEMDEFAEAQRQRRLEIAARLLSRAGRLRAQIRPIIPAMAALHLADEVLRLMDEQAAPGSEDSRCGETTRGRVTWHCSDADSGPDVGITLGLGRGQALYVGEITKRRADEWDLNSDTGWWIVLYPSGRPIAHLVDGEVARDLVDFIASALLPQHGE